MKHIQPFLLTLCLLLPGATFAASELFASEEEQFLPVEEAFQLTANTNAAGEVELYWTIADGYYLYKDRISVTNTDESSQVGEFTLPAGKEKYDELFGDVEIYRNTTGFAVPVSNSSGTANITVGYQGCADAGLCYPPLKENLMLDLPKVAALTTTAGDIGSGTNANAGAPSEQGAIANNLSEKSISWTMGWFFLAGLLLAFTPCVFPMIPILSSIIAGQGENLNASRGFSLSLVYVLAMAFTYTAAGVIVGITGANLQIWFQNPWVISTFAAIFVLLSLSMFGLYELQMPSGLQSKLNSLSGSQKQGSYAGTAVMGFLSALIVGPCVTAPLIGALLYIAETGDPVVGGIALFSLSMGMGMPLLLVGTSAAKYLPKAGAWMEPIKAVFGVMLLGLAIWFLDRIAPAQLILTLSGALAIGCAAYLGAFIRTDNAHGWLRLRQAFAWMALVYGSILIVGASAGSKSLITPLGHFYAASGSVEGAPTQDASKLPFTIVKGVDGLNAGIQQASLQNKPVMVDFYADWCIACKELEAYTFSDSKVQTALTDFVLLKVDVTANDELDKELLRKYGIFGPPAILFFDQKGNELRNYRVVGFIEADNFEQHIHQFAASSSLVASSN